MTDNDSVAQSRVILNVILDYFLVKNRYVILRS